MIAILHTIGFIDIRLLDIIDILLVAVLLFEIYNLVKGTAAINIFLGIVAIFLIWTVVRALEMELLTNILGAFISVGFIALIVIFQPEIRQFLLALGRTNIIAGRRRRFAFWQFSSSVQTDLDIDTIIMAVQRLADSQEGALIVLTKRNELEKFASTGELVDAQISSQLIENVFFKNSPLHDGAMIISNNRIKAAACILPVSNNPEVPKRMGLRHRAGLGITEESDSIAIIVSEQTGKIAVCKEGELKRNQSPAELKTFLESEFAIEK